MEHKIQKGENVFIHTRAYLAGEITLGDNANIWCGACLRGDAAPIRIGKNTNVQDNATIHVDEGFPCVLGDNVTVGHNAVVHGAIVGNNVLVGIGAVVLDGAVIEDNVIVGAGALVPARKRIVSGSIVVGNPCRVLRLTNENDAEIILLNAKAYVKRAKEYGGE